MAQLPTGLLVEITVLRFFKNGCHIGGDRVGPGVTVITGVVAIHVAEVCHERGAWIDRQKNLLENWIGNRDAIPSRIFLMRVVHGKIERRERELAAIKNASSRFLGVVHLLDDVARDLFRRIAVIGGETVEHFFVPDPVLQHLRRRFDEITGDMCSGKAAMPRTGCDFVQDVAEFVEQRFHVGMGHERRLVCARRRKIAKQRRNRTLILAVRQLFATDDRKLGEVIKFSFAREHIEIKHAERFAGGGVGYHVKLEIVDPLVRRFDFLKLQTKNALVDIEHSFEHFLEREKGAERFGVDVVLLFLELVGVVAPIPDADLRLGIVRILRFHFLERGDFGGELWLNA